MLQIQGTGNLGNDAKIKQTENGFMLTFSVAINQATRNVENQQEEKTTWINCVFFRSNNALHEYLKAGTKVFIQGELDVYLYDGASGEKKVSIQCKVNWLELLSSKKAAQNS